MSSLVLTTSSLWFPLRVFPSRAGVLFMVETWLPEASDLHLVSVFFFECLSAAWLDTSVHMLLQKHPLCPGARNTLSFRLTSCVHLWGRLLVPRKDSLRFTLQVLWPHPSRLCLCYDCLEATILRRLPWVALAHREMHCRKSDIWHLVPVLG